MLKELAPICLFTYNRLDVTKQTVKALKNNFLAVDSELYIFSDGGKNKKDKNKVNDVRAFLKTISGFKKITILKSSMNKGLADSIISGVTQIIEQHGKVIVLEDDLITSPNFLDFMNQALDFYEKSVRIQSVNGFSLEIKINNSNGDVYFHQRTFPWGWATWRNRWNNKNFDKLLIRNKIKEDKYILPRFRNACGDDIVNMLNSSLEGKNNSWYVRWVFNHFSNNTSAVFPVSSKVKNIGFNSDGTHCDEINVYRSIPDLKIKREFTFTKVKNLDYKSNTEFLRFFKKSYKIWYRVNLLKNTKGRIQVKNEIVQRLIP